MLPGLKSLMAQLSLDDRLVTAITMLGYPQVERYTENHSFDLLVLFCLIRSER